MLSEKEQKKTANRTGKARAGKNTNTGIFEVPGTIKKVKIKKRKFDGLKPFFMWPATEKGRRICLCRKHVETQTVFKDYEI